MTRRDAVTVIGGGVAGLIASIEVAEAGAPVRLLEARSRLGGRGTSLPGPWAANLGPHAVYTGTVLWDRLAAWRLVDGARMPPKRGVAFRWKGKARRVPPVAVLRPGILRGPVPEDRDLRSWATARWGPDTAEALSGLAGVVTFDHDPGRLSAAFVVERLRTHLLAPRTTARYVPGGWTTIIDGLAARAVAVGVEVETGASADAASLADLREAGPVVLAVDPGAARRLLGSDAPEMPERRRVALLDVGVRRDRDPSTVVDLDEAIFWARPSAVIGDVAPPDHELIQLAGGMAPGEPLDDAVGRLEALLDIAAPAWRDRLEWSRRGGSWEAAGAVDLPGSTWRDRPAIKRGDGLRLAGDWVAAPGHLAEVSANSAIVAAAGAVSDLEPKRNLLAGGTV